MGARSWLRGGVGIACSLAFLLSVATGCRRAPATSAAGSVADASVDAASAVARPSPAPKQKGEPDAGPTDAGTNGTAVTPEARAVAKRLEASRCRKKSCCVTNIWPGGRDRKGRELAVVAFETNEACLLPQKPAKAGRAAADEASDERHRCGEYWLVDVAAPKRPAIAELARECAGDHWEIEVDVDAEAMTFSYGGRSVYSASQTSERTTFGLDPVRLLQVERTSTGVDERTERWRSVDFSGELTIGTSSCHAKPPDGGGDAAGAPAFVEIEAVYLPQPSLPEAFVAEGWKTTGLGRCAARVGGDRGFTVHGAKGTAADASMKIVLSTPGDLFVEVTDDRFVASGKSWVKDDHLEIWAAAPPEVGCIDPSAKSPAVQWGIRVTDGAVFPGFGPPATPPPKVEVARADERTIRLRIRFEEASLPGPRLTIVYSDSDDGARQERLIATSQLVFGKWWTLGAPPADQSLSCTIVRGALEPKDRGLPGSSG